MPLRHFLYPGDPSWTEEGHNLAWHMRLRSKSGTIALFASDPRSGLIAVRSGVSAGDRVLRHPVGNLRDGQAVELARAPAAAASAASR